MKRAVSCLLVIVAALAAVVLSACAPGVEVEPAYDTHNMTVAGCYDLACVSLPPTWERTFYEREGGVNQHESFTTRLSQTVYYDTARQATLTVYTSEMSAKDAADVFLQSITGVTVTEQREVELNGYDAIYIKSAFDDGDGDGVAYFVGVQDGLTTVFSFIDLDSSGSDFGDIMQTLKVKESVGASDIAQKAGDDIIGYLYIPATWIPQVDPSCDRLIYFDPDTMEDGDFKDFIELHYEDGTVEEAVAALQRLDSMRDTMDHMETTQIALGGIEATCVTGYEKDGRIHTYAFLPDSQGRTVVIKAIANTPMRSLMPYVVTYQPGSGIPR